MQLDFFEDDEPNEDTKEEQIKCSTCKEYKHEREFPKLSKNVMMAKNPRRGGYHKNCKPCISKIQKLITTLKKENKYPKEPTCECCGIEPEKYDKLQLDHCHTTNTFRGWVCRSCNLGLGQLGDNLKGVEKALAYLRKHNERQS